MAHNHEVMRWCRFEHIPVSDPRYMPWVDAEWVGEAHVSFDQQLIRQAMVVVSLQKPHLMTTKKERGESWVYTQLYLVTGYVDLRGQ